MTVAYVLIGVLVVGGLYVAGTYNSLVTLRNRFKEAFSDIGVQQKRRHDLIPNIIETVKGYASHEKETLENVIQARNMAMNASSSGNLKEMAQAENALSSTLKSIFALSENYPDLKANENFMHLQEELVDTEDKIQAARRFYNTNVQKLVNKIEQFPSNVIANMFGFEKPEFFEVETEETAVPKVSF